MTLRRFEIRRATARDAAIIADILLAAFAEFRPIYTEPGFDATTPSAEVIRERLLAGPSWLAFVGARAAGTVSCLMNGRRCYLRSMAVLPGERHRGIGPALLQEVERFAADQGASSIYLSTTPFLHDAIRLYERCGFRRTEEQPHDLCGTPLFTMEKRLTGTPGIAPVD